KQLRRRIGSSHEVMLISIGSEILRRNRFLTLFSVNIKEIAISLLLVAIATMVSEAINYIWPDIAGAPQRQNKVIYLVAVTFAAVSYGMLAGIITVATSLLVINFLYVEPQFAFLVQDANAAANLFLFLMAGITISFFGEW
ncbi:DUF4118 domain-containing protein, partial [Stenotrophomonas geniculata]|uniref:DUF4118 domain-containing protein n=1 Tax=Stenotrophomonas geniculata TaxID=86188 RepID=UPI003BF8DDEC